MLKVKKPFTGRGYNWPNVGDFIDPAEPTRSHLIEINVAEPYENKVMPAPPENKKAKKKPKQSRSAPVARASRKKTAKRSKKTATK